MSSTLDERIAKSKEHTAKLERQKRQEKKRKRSAKKKKDQRRNYIIGELVSHYFPEVLKLEPGTKEQNTVTFSSLESFLSALASDQELVRQIKRNASNNE